MGSQRYLYDARFCAFFKGIILITIRLAVNFWSCFMVWMVIFLSGNIAIT